MLRWAAPAPAVQTAALGIHRDQEAGERTGGGGSPPGADTAPVAAVLSRHRQLPSAGWPCCGRTVPAPGVATGSVRVGVSLPSGAGQV